MFPSTQPRTCTIIHAITHVPQQEQSSIKIKAALSLFYRDSNQTWPEAHWHNHSFLESTDTEKVHLEKVLHHTQTVLEFMLLKRDTNTHCPLVLETHMHPQKCTLQSCLRIPLLFFSLGGSFNIFEHSVSDSISDLWDSTMERSALGSYANR